ncbi:hypothetical protein [Rhodoplanes roseus]|uniref:hypothetical protein n=1 Tax=Rhodoplanes roseus TaxID=29409 RepID=UPI001AECE943|nr:hypothetical protein [Rhodoplanes roseus]
MSVIDEIAAERRRQIEVEGWTSEHDDTHDSGELAGAGGYYALNAALNLSPYGPSADDVPEGWQWGEEWWKPNHDNPRRDLIKAAALIVAEIERLDRFAAPSPLPSGERSTQQASGEGVPNAESLTPPPLSVVDALVLVSIADTVGLPARLLSLADEVVCRRKREIVAERLDPQPPANGR